MLIDRQTSGRLYPDYRLNLSIRFIDPKTNAEIGAIPSGPYAGNTWRFVNKLSAGLDEVSQKVKVEVTGAAKTRIHTAH